MKYIGNLIAVSLKHFFDFDQAYCHHLFLLGLILIGVVRMFISRMGSELVAGMLTVNEDLVAAKKSVLSSMNEFDHVNLRQRIFNYSRSSKDTIQKDNFSF